MQTLYANGIAQFDKVQFFFNDRTGEVVFMDYGSLEIFSPTLYNRAVSDGFVKRDAAVFTMTRPVDEDLKFVLYMLEEAIRIAEKKVAPSAPVSRREARVIAQLPMVSGAESMVAAGDTLLVAEDAGVVGAQLMQTNRGP